MKSPFVFLAKCVNNEGESFGLPVSNYFQKGSCYFIDEIAKSGMYEGEVIAKVYDLNRNLIAVSPDIQYWKLSDRFIVIPDKICLN